MSSTVVFEIFLSFNLSLFNSLLVLRDLLQWIEKKERISRRRSTPVSTVLRKSVEFFINKYFCTRFRIKISQVEIWPISCLNDPENEMRDRILGLSQWPDLFFFSFICEDSLCTSVSSPHTKIRGKTLSSPFFFYQYTTYKGLELKRFTEHWTRQFGTFLNNRVFTKCYWHRSKSLQFQLFITNRLAAS